MTARRRTRLLQGLITALILLAATPAVAGGAARATPIRTGTFKGTARVVFHNDGTTLLGAVTLRIAGPLRNLDNTYRVTFAGSVSGTWNSYPAGLSNCKVTNPSSLAVRMTLNAQSVQFWKGHLVSKLGFDINGKTTGTLNLLCNATNGSTYTEQTPADDQLLYQALMPLNISHIGGPHTFSSVNPPGITVTITLPG